MSDQRCELCNRLFIENELVRVTMLATFHNATYPLHALDPIEEIMLIHQQCHNEEE